MSGASEQVPAAIHLVLKLPRAVYWLEIQTGDLIRLDATTGELTAKVEDSVLASRVDAAAPGVPGTIGRQIFAN